MQSNLLEITNSIITSDLPAIIQANALLELTSAQWLETSPVECQSCKSLSPDISIWLRNTEGIITNTNHVRDEALGHSASEFVGLDYRQLGVNKHLIDFRLYVDQMIAVQRRPLMFIEPSEFGIADTLNIPIFGDDGGIEATLHMAIPHK